MVGGLLIGPWCQGGTGMPHRAGVQSMAVVLQRFLISYFKIYNRGQKKFLIADWRSCYSVPYCAGWVAGAFCALGDGLMVCWVFGELHHLLITRNCFKGCPIEIKCLVLILPNIQSFSK